MWPSGRISTLVMQESQRWTQHTLTQCEIACKQSAQMVQSSPTGLQINRQTNGIRKSKRTRVRVKNDRQTLLERSSLSSCLMCDRGGCDDSVVVDNNNNNKITERNITNASALIVVVTKNKNIYTYTIVQSSQIKANNDVKLYSNK